MKSPTGWVSNLIDYRLVQHLFPLVNAEAKQRFHMAMTNLRQTLNLPAKFLVALKAAPLGTLYHHLLAPLQRCLVHLNVHFRAKYALLAKLVCYLHQFLK
jgi:hypothetical protein